MINTVCRYFFIFMVFSVGGWIVETLLYMIRDGKVVKRGFLFGPVCPIYGVSAILCRALFYGTVDNIAVLFILGFLTTGLIEYITHFIMEKVFHAMWWDYSDRKFNIHGRVYLKGLLIFGAGVVLIIKYLMPLLDKLLNLMSPVVLYSICFGLYTVLVVDFATTLVDLKGIINILKTVQSSAIGKTQRGVDLTAEQMEKVVDLVKNSDVYVKAKENINHRKNAFNHFKRRYPNFTLKKYKYIIDSIGEPSHDAVRDKSIKHFGTADSIPGAENGSDEANAERKQNKKPDAKKTDKKKKDVKKSSAASKTKSKKKGGKKKK